MDLSTECSVRDFLRLCLDPGHGIKRTPAKLAGIMPGPLEDAVMRYAPHLAELRDEANRQEKQARKARKAYTDALAAWIADEEPTAETSAPALCPQNRVGDKAVQSEHFYELDADSVLRCVFCGTPAVPGSEPELEPRPRTYVFNADSVNRTTKHAANGRGGTLCPRDFRASAPIPHEKAAGLALCGGCRRALTREKPPAHHQTRPAPLIDQT